jgi:hypothetical protein
MEANRQCQGTAPQSPFSTITQIDDVGREEESTEWFAATVQVEKPDDNIYAVVSLSRYQRAESQDW